MDTMASAASMKSAIIPNVRGGNVLAYNEGVRQLKVCGWKPTGHQHPKDNTPVFFLGNCYLWRDPDQNYDWFMDTPDGVYGVDGSIANITQEAQSYADEPIPWQGEPAVGDDELGLEARG